MADEDGLPTGALSLEENPTIVGITEKDPPAADADDDAVPDGTIEGTGGVQFAPVKAVISERTQRKEAQKEAATLKTQLAEAQAKAKQFDELSGYVEQARPIIEAVRNRPDLVEAAKKPATPAEAPKPMTDAEAIEYAKDFDLYKTDGTPDVDRAQRIVGREVERAARAAQTAVAPFQANDAKRTSDAMFNHIAAFKDANGHMVDRGELTKVWEIVPPELSAKPEVAAIIYDLALAASIRAGKYKGTQAQQPAVLQTESLGGGGKVTRELDAVGAKFARAADMKPGEFAKQSERFKPGQTNSLE